MKSNFCLYISQDFRVIVFSFNTVKCLRFLKRVFWMYFFVNNVAVVFVVMVKGRDILVCAFVEMAPKSLSWLSLIQEFWFQMSHYPF